MIVSLLTGVFLIVVPWSAFWESNYLLQPYPAVRALLLSGSFRGAVSALGVLNVVLAMDDAQAHLRGRGERF